MKQIREKYTKHFGPAFNGKKKASGIEKLGLETAYEDGWVKKAALRFEKIIRYHRKILDFKSLNDLVRVRNGEVVVYQGNQPNISSTVVSWCY